ncbi:BamA/TamA family outer membrane protein [Fulvivirgaceae bacterium PWU5]|uniref:BamA/TamA family outer membrane protein n=1 Tax=Dawidia cretensis TaxID=2782350 RepID=A0AAP2GS37_9BACT|nr:BamA/TamA family outer membrane protein [Dawidia cretensis]MBT1711296.1 BamA/TamA family outer membrane protein [Dawidia cretensis]
MIKRLLLFSVLSFSLLPDTFAQQKKVSFYLIGDAGEPTLSTNGMQELLQTHHDPAVPATAVFLGDNVYPKGMPDVNDGARQRAEKILRDQIALLNGFNATMYFIPGNHDWKRGRSAGWEQLMHQQAFIDSLHNPAVHFAPQDGCPGPVEIAVNDQVTLVIMDSQWFLHPWDKPAGDDSPCAAKRPEDVLISLEDIFLRNQHKRVIVAAHHPLYTYGEHGGVFTWKDHLFPLYDLNHSLYIPMPVVGSIYPLYRKVFGNIQDTAHPLYKRYIRLLSGLLEKYPNTLYVSGHDHNLQYSYKDSVHYIVSGAGSKATNVRKKGYARFVSRHLGFVKVDVLDNGAATVDYYQTGQQASVYHIDVPAPPAALSADAGNLPDFSKTVRVHASDQYEAGRFKQKMLGKNYRAEWKQDLDVPVFDMGTKAGGLKIVQKGGGMQTLSLRLENSQGEQYTLRSVEKFPAKAVPEMLQNTFAQDLVQDQISASHPYGALIIAPLARAAGVYHTHPELVYIPDDPRLGIYRKEFANTLALFEERPEGEAKDKPHFGNADKIISYDKLLGRLAKDNDNVVDQEFVMHSRLFDLVIGDWDRHDDQWRWAQFKEKKAEIYRPIPRDRDQAFFASDGTLARVWSRRWALPKFEGFREDVNWVPGFMFNGRYFDRSFLNATTSAEWVAEAKKLQQQLTDAVIDSAVKQFPPSIYTLHGAAIAHKMKARRDRLPEYALAHYKFLAKEVDVAGSDKPEYFDVEHQANGDVQVKVYKINKDNERTDKIYDRLFLRSETKEVRLFGQGGDDVFDLRGEGKGGILLRIIGGDGRDSVTSTASVGGLLKAHKAYDLESGMTFGERKDLDDARSVNPAVNLYDRKAFRYPRLAPLITGNYNYDDGLFLGGGFLFTTHGFRKQPYASQHLFLASYAPVTGSYNFRYDGRFQQVFGKWGIMLDFDVKAPNFVNNFFGWGNETVYDDDIDDKPIVADQDLNNPIDFYRLRLQQVELQAMLTRPLGSIGYFRIGPMYQRTEIEAPKNTPRFISEYAKTLDEPLFEVDKQFVGGRVQWGIDKRDNPVVTTRGILLTESSLFMKGIEARAHNFTSHNATLSFYQSFRIPARVTFALRVGGGINTGNYEIYQAQILDGRTELRGYRKTRFYGDRDFYSNNEVRMKLASFRSYLFPASLGINGFYDIGRVWYKDATGKDPSTADGTSSAWHKGVGGGIWFTPFNLAVLSTEMAFSKDGNMVYLRLGFLF